MHTLSGVWGTDNKCHLPHWTLPAPQWTFSDRLVRRRPVRSIAGTTRSSPSEESRRVCECSIHVVKRRWFQNTGGGRSLLVSIHPHHFETHSSHEPTTQKCVPQTRTPGPHSHSPRAQVQMHSSRVVWPSGKHRSSWCFSVSSEGSDEGNRAFQRRYEGSVGWCVTTPDRFACNCSHNRRGLVSVLL